MKKNIIKIYFTLIALLISLDNVYANSDENSIKIITYLICIAFIVGGIIIIVISNKNNSTKIFDYDKQTESIKTTKKEEEPNKTNNFNPDSIFKTIPTFSNKKFFDKTFETLKKDIEKDETIKNIIILKKEIINFEEKDNKYIFTTKFKINYTQTQDNKEIKIEKNYTTTTEKSKKIILEQCPTCGGKIKDNTLLRCKYCDSILPKNENIVELDWVITEIKVDEYSSFF